MPAVGKETSDYCSLIVETAKILKRAGKQTAVALHHWQSLSYEAYDAVDAIHLMAYDLPNSVGCVVLRLRVCDAHPHTPLSLSLGSTPRSTRPWKRRGTSRTRAGRRGTRWS